MKKKTRGKSISVPATSIRTEALNKATSKAHAAVDVIAGVTEEAVRMATPAVNRVAAMANVAADKAVDTAASTADWVAEQARNLKSRRQRRVRGSSA